MSFQFPIIELVDRYTIALVKYDKTNGANSPELTFYTEQINKIDVALIQHELDQLESIHRQIWALEDDLSEIGQRALDIRDINNLRVRYKNSIAEKLNDAVREIKQDHASQ